ncbi:GSK3-beta interaction protein-like [Mya arenaria]|uniref:GSK3-beta interaction protein-like n=1 Tax=Mya arenaria TaxID=6604 RepID=UPI0022E294E0|nr:GSK3-beta interaction protein-like [Mya arenaria]
MADDENYSLKIEAKEVIKEIAYAVKHVSLSAKLESTNERVFFNLETKECERYCVELSLNGFRLASRQYDSIDDGSGARYFETIYALLDSISLGYRNTFGDTLIQRLQGLENRKSPSLGEDS